MAETDRCLFYKDGTLREPLTSRLHTQVKQLREALFPDSLLEAALEVLVQNGQASVESDRTHILNSIMGLPPPTHGAGDNCNCPAPLAEHPG